MVYGTKTIDYISQVLVLTRDILYSFVSIHAIQENPRYMPLNIEGVVYLRLPHHCRPEFKVDTIKKPELLRSLIGAPDHVFRQQYLSHVMSTPSHRHYEGLLFHPTTAS